jgi:hypothetical protein
VLELQACGGIRTGQPLCDVRQGLSDGLRFFGNRAEPYSDCLPAKFDLRRRAESLARQRFTDRGG